MGRDKLWVDVGGAPLVAMTVAAAADAACFDAVCIAAPRARWDDLRAIAAPRFADVRFVEGGDRRQDSVRAALAESAMHEIVCVHDAARPLAGSRLFTETVAAARTHGAATTAVPIVDAVKRVHDGMVTASLPRDEYAATQTPQAFRTPLLQRAHAVALEQGVQVDDDAALVELLGEPIAIVPGARRNIKVTHAEDLDLLHALVGVRG